MLQEEKKCTGCAACYNICPRNAIEMISNEEGFLCPSIDPKKCIQCGKCDNICPCMTEKVKTSKMPPAYYAARAKQEEIESTSGGMFAVTARYVLEQGGVVFGAAFDRKFKVVHRCIESQEELKLLQGSKYVQSEIGVTFRKAERYLKMGKTVLFTGTGCQIAGLLSFLGKDYEKLICMEIICHGVPAPKVWEKYLNDFHAKKTIKKVCFRENEQGQEKVFCIQYKNGKTYKKKYPNDPYIWGFCYDLFLRSSCYACQYKGMERIADITIGDAWGCEQYAKRIYKREAKTSLVLVNTEKGRELFQQLQEQLVCEEVNGMAAIKNNMQLVKSVALNPNRYSFFEGLKKHCFKAVLLKHYWKKG